METTLRETIEQLETSAELPHREGADRFSGYAVMGVPFRSGHVLALRRFAASSVGPAYTSVWHRDPDGKWTFYSTAAKEHGCGRYFSNAVEKEIRATIHIDWVGPRAFRLRVDGLRPLRWDVELTETPASRIMNAMGQRMPESWWQTRTVLRAMGTMARFALGTGKMNMTGYTPNGQEFEANPRGVWMVRASHAVLGGVDLGPVRALPQQAHLRDMWIPQRGVFAVVDAFLKPALRTWKAA